MAEHSLVCNNRNCKVLLTDFACVTKCLHIFCKHHIIRGESVNRRCHACNTFLDGYFDVVHQDNLNPSEEFKSIMLTGYSFEVISEIISRAFRFWDYQTNIKIMQYKSRVESMRIHLDDKNRYIESLTLNIKHYIKKQQERVDYLKREVENSADSVRHLKKQLEGKNNQLFSLQSRYEELRRSSMATLITQETSSMEIEELNDIVCSQHSVVGNKIPLPATPMFVFHPKTKRTPNSGSSGSHSDLFSHI